MTETSNESAPTAEFTITRVFDAPRELVFQAWTDPAHFTHWFGPRAFTTPLSKITMEPAPGGEWRAILVSGDGMEIPLYGTYREVAGPARLVFTTGDPDNTAGDLASVVTVDLADLGGKTEMTFHQAGVNTDEAHAEQSRAGWIEFFDRLAEHLTGHLAGDTTA
ncbi:SRPBCC domain-containing protein [Planotetraspora sp. A-T 1434]|uniref:SRPBCC family protein n=1 Tax=Planotetraspora sp. A-T 1434 TaxID=2979219 RepID=UPI0021BF315E|nr:SRPBCC domain-containing protein [Planotetraspora sp. A-T 1434]MCT9933046.1 SRPBCC domain-containing protein [Planotetraspora sp. A-T 1434]